MAFITRCPNCDTSFNITQSQLRKAAGIVRCGFCLQTFSALEHQLYLEEDLEEDFEENPEENFVAGLGLGKEEDIDLGELDLETDLPETEDDMEELPEHSFMDMNLEVQQPEPETETEEAAESEELEDDYQIPTLEAANEAFEDSEAEETEDSAVEDDFTEEKIVADEPDGEPGTEDQGAIHEDSFDDEEMLSQYEEILPESDSEEEYDLATPDEEPEPADPPHAAEHRPETGRTKSPQKKELQILDSLYDDSELDQLDTNNFESLGEEPIIIQQQQQRSRLVKNLLLSLNIILIFGLGAQYIWQHLDSLLLDQRLAPLSGMLCQVISCPPVAQFDLNQFSTEELIVNAHPDFENALQVDFIFRNNANYAQAFPLVELNFTDLNQRLLANRVFTPQEYLDPELREFELMPADSSIQIQLQISDPGPAAINYTLALRRPGLL